ncbi:NifB/NifX family molybdenum-iron cluster-binding protein [Desulfolucanica intricata]|uniref:NifB/NifX family molybdenum-iron cluster-binding protein n=1 Tax=Desulfolucanica intricata TaxID=1285191 RepID=UPI00082C61F0|nr:NifB/NifX family molybdenum-iron cluster-binding protein [Desulfolucanica intricata]
MKIAIPIAENKLCTHFGHCETFYFFNVNMDTQEITGKEILEAPPHEPGLLPRLLSEKGVNVVIAGGMGAKAQDLFNQRGIKVVVGVNPAVGSPENIVKTYLSGSLQAGTNPCDH